MLSAYQYSPPPPNTSHNKCEGTYEYIFQQGQVVIQYLDWDPSHVDLIYWAYASVCEDLCVCVRELEMSVCLWLEDVCKLKKNQGILKKVRKISDFGRKQEKIMDGEKGKKNQGFQKTVKKSRISEEGIKNQGFLTKVRKNNGGEKKVKKSRISEEVRKVMDQMRKKGK